MGQKALRFRFLVTATLLGNTLEWYDLAIFAFLIPLFSKIFFAAEDPQKSLALALTALGFGSVSRPIGGILFGWIGDRLGRRFALMSSVLVMSVPIVLIGCLPTYAQIGAAAWILMEVLRVFQGIAAGGELPGAVTFLVESAPQGKEGWYGSFGFFGVVFGVFLGVLDLYFLSGHLAEKGFEEWGWRLLFFAGGILGIIAFLLRRKLHETSIFQHLRENHEILHDPTKVLFISSKRRIIQLVGIAILEALAFNLLIHFSVSYFNTVLGVPFTESVGLGLVMLTIMLFMIPFAGKCSALWSPKKIAFLGAWGFLLFSVPLYILLQWDSYRMYAVVGFAVLLGLYIAPLPALFAGLYPARVRFSGIGIGYNLTVAIFGAFAPLAGLKLFHLTGWKAAPALLLIGGALIALGTLYGIRERTIKPM